MKIELIRNEANKTVGWKLVGETKEDKLRLGTIRNIEFFGMGDDHVEYDGIRTDPENSNYVAEVYYVTKGYAKERDAKLRERIEEENHGQK